MGEFAVALVGGGNIAKAHLAAAKESGGRVRVAAVVDPLTGAREAIAREAGIPAFESIQKLLGSTDVGAIRGAIVATPPNARIPIVSALLERGIAVLVEKPIAQTLADARVLNELAARHPKTVAAVGYCHRFTPAIAEMKRRIDDGEIGTVSRFENTFATYLPKMREHWMSDPAVSGGGSFMDTGCHSLDLFLHLLGEAEIRSATFHHAWPGRGESSATVHLRQAPEHAPGGATAGVPRAAGVIQSGWLEPGRFTVTVVGTKGSLHYDYDRGTELLHRPNDGAGRPVEVNDHGQRFTLQLQAFADAVDNGARSALAGFRDGLITAALVDAAQKAAHNE
jgi:predicted dehydrogenase